MARAPARSGKARSARSTPGTARSTTAPEPRWLAVGRPLQARLIALEKQIGLFSEEQSFAADSRFRHPVLLPAETPLPEGMARVFEPDVASLRRRGKPADTVYRAELGPYRVHCLAYFDYDGFRALLYVEQDGTFIGAWREEEVLHPNSPHTFLAGVADGEIERFLAQVAGG